MEVKDRLKICIVLSVLAFIAEIIVCAGPGWVVLEYRVPDYGVTADDLVDNRSNISIKFGVWYYKVCKSYYDRQEACGIGNNSFPLHEGVFETNEADDRINNHGRHFKKFECFHRRYFRGCHVGTRDKLKINHGTNNEYVDEDSKHFVKERNFICIAADVGRQGREEIAIYVTIGLVFGLCGIISAVIYAESGGSGKLVGKIAFSSQILSSVVYWLAVGRVSAYVVQLRSLQKHEVLDDHFGKDIRFILPWCLILGGISAILMDISAFLLFVIISKENKCNRSENQSGKGNETRLSIIVPKGYKELVLPYSSEDSGPLPEKKPVP